MGVQVIKVPDLGEGIAEVELVAWHVKPGDAVVLDQALADVMTDKATVEIPSSVAGRVLALGGEVGQVMAVGAELIRIEGAGDAPIPAFPQGGKEPNGSPELAAKPAPSPVPLPLGAGWGGGSAQTQPEPPPTRPVDKPIASPAVRRRAWELGIALRDVAPTGTAGRIVHADLDAHVARGGPRRDQLAERARGVLYAEREGQEVVPVIGLRRKIAQKMQEAKRRIPHFTYVEEVDVTELEALRARLNALHARPDAASDAGANAGAHADALRGHLTLLPFLVRGIVMAVAAHPELNAHFDDEAGRLTRHAAVHLGIATQTHAGLMVPVLRHAEAHDLWSAAQEIARLAGAARAGQITREELSGSTITLTSLGTLGGVVSTPIINHPEVAIVGVNRIVQRPVIQGGLIVPRLMMNLSSSFDHRVIDGELAARFVQALRSHLESPATLFVE